MKAIFLLFAAFVFSISTIALANKEVQKQIFVTNQSLTKETQRQVECLADNIFFEAAYEPSKGKVAVALVTFNRVASLDFPNDVCSVVKQRRRAICQFSWYCQAAEYRKSYNKEKYLTNFEKRAYNSIYDLAIHLYMNVDTIVDYTDGALFYHADYVSLRKIGVPNLEKTTKIGLHIFYKPGANDGKYDAKTKLRVERRPQLAFVLSSDGRH